MIKKYIEREYDLEAVLVELDNLKKCSAWLNENEIQHQLFGRYIMYGKPNCQTVVNTGEYLVKGLGGQFSTASAELFNLCFKDKEETKKTKAKK